MSFIQSIKKSYQDWKQRRQDKKLRAYFQPKIDKMLEYTNRHNFVYTRLFEKVEQEAVINKKNIVKEIIPILDIRQEDKHGIWCVLRLSDKDQVSISINVEDVKDDPILVAVEVSKLLNRVIAEAAAKQIKPQGSDKLQSSLK